MDYMKIKGLDIGFKDVDLTKRTVTGYLAHFGSLDYAKDITEKGAFLKSINEFGPNGKQLIKFLLDHKKDHAVGVFTVLKEDETGLYYEGKVGRHSAGNDFLFMVEDGIINQHSFAYNTIKEDKKSDGNHLQELDILEGSALQFRGCNPNTPSLGIKSLEDILTDIAVLEKGIKDGKYTDEVFLDIYTRIDNLRTELKTRLEPESKSFFSLINSIK